MQLHPLHTLSCSLIEHHQRSCSSAHSHLLTLPPNLSPRPDLGLVCTSVRSVTLKRLGRGPARLRLHTALAPVARRLPGNQPKPKSSRRYASRSRFSTFNTQPSRTRMTQRALGTAGGSGALEACWSSRSLSEEDGAGFNLARGLYACLGSGSGSGSGSTIRLSRCKCVIRIVAGYCCAARASYLRTKAPPFVCRRSPGTRSITTSTTATILVLGSDVSMLSFAVVTVLHAPWALDCAFRCFLTFSIDRGPHRT